MAMGMHAKGKDIPPTWALQARWGGWQKCPPYT